MIKVLINGANGRMGQEAVAAINQQPDLKCVAAIGRHDDLAAAIQHSGAQVVVDLTIADVVYQNASIIIQQGVHPVIGTSGLTPQQIAQLQQQCHKQQLGGILAPNFSIGAILMMKSAREIAAHYHTVEIIEMHHEGKRDAPSATAIKTAELIAQSDYQPGETKHCQETLPGARGASCQGIPIHSVRMPGLVAHQQVMFGGQSELLTLRHDTLDRKAFMPGICFSCRKVLELNELVYGLEHLL
jgi:4-hydroxy-tetrahydrodipicolinate reductase